jgi:hypothetical protein
MIEYNQLLNSVLATSYYIGQPIQCKNKISIFEGIVLGPSPGIYLAGEAFPRFIESEDEEIIFPGKILTQPIKTMTNDQVRYLLIESNVNGVENIRPARSGDVDEACWRFGPEKHDRQLWVTHDSIQYLKFYNNGYPSGIRLPNKLLFLLAGMGFETDLVSEYTKPVGLDALTEIKQLLFDFGGQLPELGKRVMVNPKEGQPVISRLEWEDGELCWVDDDDHFYALGTVESYSEII